MELVTHTISVNRRDHGPYVIVPIGDIQWAGRPQAVALEALKETIQRGLELNARFVGMGDMIDFASPSNRQRLRAAALYDTAEDTIDDKALDLVRDLYERALKPTRGRWLGLLQGHHYMRLQEGDTTDMRLCQMLEAPFLGDSAFIRLVFRTVNSNQRQNVVFWVHHGSGGGQKMYAPVMKLEGQVMPYIEGADVFLIGHMTKTSITAINRIAPRWHSGRGCPPDLVHRKLLLVGTGGYCVPLDAEILTEVGWRSHGEVRAGLRVLGWEDGHGLTWTRVRGVSRFHRQVTDRLHSRSFDAICTPQHQWETIRLRIPTHMLRPSDRIRVAAGTPCSEGGTILLSAEEATLLAWVVTDGYISGPATPGLTIGISQWKEPYRTMIRQSLGKWIRSESGHTFLLHTAKFQDLCWRLGTDPRRLKLDSPWLVAAMAPEARTAWFQAALEAEGSQDTGGWSFWQVPGPILDAFEIAATLEGYRVGRSQIKGGAIRVRVHRRVFADVANLKKTRAGIRDVWCPETESGNWVMRWRGHITLTGNSKSYVEHALRGRVPEGGYAEKRMLPPAVLGSPFVYIRPRTRSQKGRTEWAPAITVEA